MSDKRPNGMRSNAENILRAALGEAVKYDNPNSPVEYYLVKLKEAIEGGGSSSDYATDLLLSIDSSTYVLTAQLLNKDGDPLGDAQTIDLPLESIIAAKAIADQDGNNIKQTYVKKADEYNAGKTVPQGTTVTFRGQTYTVADNAEIFNAYSYNTATGKNSHAEGESTAATGMSSHSEGGGTWASGIYSHAEGSGTNASGTNSHSEGGGTTASGSQAHSEGGATTASGIYSHAEGSGTTARGMGSHSEGYYTKASSMYQHVEGKWNVEDANDKFAHIIGNGTSNNARSNAYAVDWDGKIYTHNSATGFDINSNYLEMPNGIRLYISATTPTGDIPDGSVGVGW